MSSQSFLLYLATIQDSVFLCDRFVFGLTVRCNHNDKLALSWLITVHLFQCSPAKIMTCLQLLAELALRGIDTRKVVGSAYSIQCKSAANIIFMCVVCHVRFYDKNQNKENSTGEKKGPLPLNKLAQKEQFKRKYKLYKTNSQLIIMV